jgi:hypothetical protein
MVSSTLPGATDDELLEPVPPGEGTEVVEELLSLLELLELLEEVPPEEGTEVVAELLELAVPVGAEIGAAGVEVVLGADVVAELLEAPGGDAHPSKSTASRMS